jgi:ethanolamine utilization microcompartment shell protein EutL
MYIISTNPTKQGFYKIGCDVIVTHKHRGVVLQATNNTMNFHTNLHLNSHCTKTGAAGSGTSPGESSTYLANNPVGGVTVIGA